MLLPSTPKKGNSSIVTLGMEISMDFRPLEPKPARHLFLDNTTILIKVATTMKIVSLKIYVLSVTMHA